MDPVWWYYGSSKGELMDLLVVRGHVRERGTCGYRAGAAYGSSTGARMDPVRRHVRTQWGALVDLLVIRGHLWITGFGYCAGVLINQVRAHEWVRYGGTYGSSERSLVDLIVVRGRL